MLSEDPDDFLDFYISTRSGFSSIDYYSSLPVELHLKILDLLPFPFLLLSLGSLCKSFHRLLSSNSKLWHSLALRTFSFVSPCSDWRASFQDRYLLEKKLSDRRLGNKLLLEGAFDFFEVQGRFAVVHPISDPIAFDVLHICDLETGKLKSISPDITSYPSCTLLRKNRLYVGTEKGAIHIFDLKSASEVDLVVVPPEREGVEEPVAAVDTNEFYTVAASRSGRVVIWRLAYGRESRPVQPTRRYPGIQKVVLLDHWLVLHTLGGLKVLDILSSCTEKFSWHSSRVDAVHCFRQSIYFSSLGSLYQLDPYAPHAHLLFSGTHTALHLEANERFLVCLDSSQSVTSFDLLQKTSTLVAPDIQCFRLCSTWYLILLRTDGRLLVKDFLGTYLRTAPRGYGSGFTFEIAESGFVVLGPKRLLHFYWENTSWKRKYQEYEDLLVLSPLVRATPKEEHKKAPLRIKEDSLDAFWGRK
eukprot:TRINITY_DN21460_c0_g1_i1.p1 TRINITY_DN21460_c0_g1~~TRINITY_DN21460_c0_g1_i1.p1  ORF type:complete len:472 (-),score=60.90 TRINITY_DN21460_c0_g1_i1:2-1417(-)